MGFCYVNSGWFSSFRKAGNFSLQNIYVKNGIMLFKGKRRTEVQIQVNNESSCCNTLGYRVLYDWPPMK